MKLVVLVPSAEYMNYAGSRIRYQRVAPELAKHDIELQLQDINDFSPDRTDADVLIISKCHDPLSLVAAAVMAKRGKLVGVDLFDDYFSQDGDSRMSRFRTWLDQILRSCDFVLCSTEAMAAVARRYRADIPVHVMNDPAADLRMELLPQILRRKLHDTRASLKMTVAWFGVGDNPHFPVGLPDLASFSGVLKELRAADLDVELRVLTNARALTADGLALIEALPVRTAVAEWSEQAEEELLATAFLAFLPVSRQPFSTAKSLNRAVSALTAGCQVLSVGYPLYDKLEPLVYRDAAAFLQDLSNGTMRLSADRIAEYGHVMEEFASAEAEASRLGNFLSELKRKDRQGGTLVVLHGHSTSGAAHKLVQAVNGLSVASPYCTAQLGFDVVFKATPDGLSMRMSEKASRRLQDRRRDLVPVEENSGRRYVEMPKARQRAAALAGAGTLDEVPVPLQLATYPAWIEEMRMRMTAAFGPCRFIVAETSRLPFSLVH
jgi:hypothetical protein